LAKLSRKAWLISGIAAAVLFIGAVASNLVASYLQTGLDPYRRWVWVCFVIALLVAIGGAVKEVSERQHSTDSTAGSTRSTVQGNRNIVIGGDAKKNKFATGNDNVLGDFNVEGDYIDRREIQITDPNYFLNQVNRDEQPFDREVYKNSEWGDLRIEGINEFLALERVKLQDDYKSALSPKQQFEEFLFVQPGAKPTNGANLCFGERPSKVVAGCLTRCFYWKEPSRDTGFLENKDFNGNLVVQMNEALSFVKRHLRLERTIGSQTRSDEYDLPIVAIAEAIANALVHREYRNRNDSVRVDVFDDKIEIISPGGLPKQIPLEVLGVEQETYPRNPLIARIFYLYGYVEQAGTGISRMKGAMIARGLPEPEFKVSGANTFHVILRRSLPASSGIAIGAKNSAIIINDSAQLPTQLHQLRPPVGDFVGRQNEIETLIKALRSSGRATITRISGMGGIGKTELALFVAHFISDDYPDAQLFINLQGTDAKPRTPEEALAICIRAFLGPEQSVPEDLDQLTQLYYSQLKGKRVLLLLDNAADSAQVRPLLPPSGSALLVTSRQAIALPGMTGLTLNALTEEEAKKLLLEIAPRAESVAEQICKLCGYLPLAIRAAGSLLAITPDLDPVDYVTQLKNEQNRIERIGGEGVEIGVTASFNLSYALLPPEAARVFRSLSIFPGTFGATAAEVVCADQGHAQLSELVRRSVVVYDAGAKRYRLHDLARLFADTKLSAEERASGLKRYAIHYKDVLAVAENLYLQGSDALIHGLALFDLEWNNIQTGHSWVATQGVEADEDVTRLGITYPNVGIHLLQLRLHSREQIRWMEIALASSQRLNDRAGKGWALSNLGAAYEYLGDTQRAVQFNEQALLIDRERGDRRGEGASLGNLGNAYANLGETAQAIQFYEQALAIRRELGDRRSQGHMLGNLGMAYAKLGDIKRAMEFHEQALIIAREHGDRRGESITLSNLGTMYLSLGELQRAIEFNEQALVIGRELGDRRGEGHTLWNMSLALDRLGWRAQAIQHAEQALVIGEQIEDPDVALIRSQLAAWREETNPN
jgi:predicted HTH transcriptional regulator/tetratricopeptide (TPR) repeat protein